MKNENIAIVESYINALKEKDVSGVPLTAEMIFEEPLTPTLTSAEAVRAYLPNIFPLINDLRIKKHIAEGEYVATLWEVDSPLGVIPVFECFRIVDGQITEIRAFFDQRPITNPGK